ncbi:dynamin family protein [Romeria aff. gracilis LEGE 07310]|uniref:Dynamin family protein n=1 Tax=Vasconcelosia minhoensis LEGE 07310 TaxID=915328 RepID=A0A8J7AKQ6_9CYAN|nr:dynamin family protein [Romeria gracilis]MBE9075886.1 dynamin family protein [Romeria aff. gracilis LEGE 07310]
MTQTPASFIDYKRTLFAIASDLKRLQYFAEKLGLENSFQLLSEVLRRIQTDSFSVAVVGEFKRGKSTFINALLGQEILPSDILPCSATINRVSYGLRPLVKVRFNDAREEEVAIEQLADYVTKLTAESEVTAASVKEAVVYYPIHFCQNNIDLIDTPGLSDEESMTKVTLSVLPQVDAAIMVILAQSPFSEVERAFLEDKLLTTDLGRVIFVVTGIDLLNSSEDADRIVQLVRERIETHVLQRCEQQFGKDSQQYKDYLKKVGTLKVFGLSAYQALQAKSNHDTDLLARSRFSEFEAALERFLLQERGTISLQVPINRIISSTGEIIETISAQQSALQRRQEAVNIAYETAAAEITNLQQGKQAQKQRANSTFEGVKQRIRPLLDQLDSALKQAAVQAILSCPIADADFADSQLSVSMSKLDQKVTDDIERASRILAGRIQSEIRKGLMEDGDRDSALGNEISQLLNGTGIQLIHISRLLKAAITQGRVAWRVGYSAKSGIDGWLTSNFMDGELGKNFKSGYQKAIEEEIEKQLRLNSQLRQKLASYVYGNLDAIKAKRHQEIELMRNEPQSSLAEFQLRRERDAIAIEIERQKLDEISTETQRIQCTARELSEQLLQVIGW